MLSALVLLLTSVVSPRVQVSLSESDRASMRVPFDQPERPLLNSMKNRVIAQGFKFWA